MASAQAQAASPAGTPDMKARAPARPDQAQDATTRRFREGVAAIIAGKSPASGPAWSDIDRDRLADHFRLPDDRLDDKTSASGPMAWSVTSRTMVDRSAGRRGMSLVIDGGAPSQAPTDQSAERTGRIAEYELASASACSGLMPTVACASSVNGDDSMVRLALAYNF